MTDQATQVSHLTLIVSGMVQGRDILELPDEEGGIQLDDDEDDLLELVTEIAYDVVPNYYNGDTQRFLFDFLSVLNSTSKDHEEEGAAGETQHSFIENVRFFIDKIYEAGRKMVA